ncbi:MAG: carboxylate--amine ligase [Pseudonocardiaceae bacterium]|nr:carboxylate--amine ligase [Pseudonocardiaceae bacterium]
MTEIDSSTPAVVLKFDPNPMHHGGLGVIRSLGRRGVPVYGVHEDRMSPAATSRYLVGRWYWRADPDDVERVHTELLRLAERIGRPAVLLPTDDAGAIFLAEHGEGLRHAFRFSAPPATPPRQLAGKHSLYQLCQENGVPCPQAGSPRSLDEATEFATRTGFPVIAKLDTPWRPHGTRLRSTAILHERAELVELYDTCARHGIGVLLQEFVPGDDWFFHGYCDEDSVCRPAFTGVKDRSYPAHAGLTSLGRSVPNELLRTQAVELLSRLGYRGIVDLDFRLDSRDGTYKLLDFNPRLGAQFRLFRDTAGLDVALAAYLDLTGGVIAERAQVAGRRFLAENYDPIAARGYRLGPRSWAASLRGVDELAWFARDDPRPFGLMCLRMGWRAATRGFSAGGRESGSGEPRYRPGRAALAPGPARQEQ